MELSIEELNKLLEAAAERGAAKALETLGYKTPVIPYAVQADDVNKDIITSLPRMSARQYEQMENERIKKFNQESGNKLRRIPLRKGPVFRALRMNEIVAANNHRLACEDAGVKKTKLNFEANPAPMSPFTEMFIEEHNENVRAKQRRSNNKG